MIVHEETKQVAREDQPAPVCCHYWIIETANGPISRGECEICHEVRDFKKSVFDMDRSSQDNRSTKRTAVEENGQHAVASQASEDLKSGDLKSGDLNSDDLDRQPDAHEPDVDQLDPEESGMDEPEIAEPAVEEPEFVAVSEK